MILSSSQRGFLRQLPPLTNRTIDLIPIRTVLRLVASVLLESATGPWEAAATAQTPIAKKERYRWLQGVKVSETGLPEAVHCVYVGDREADIFELFVQPRGDRSDQQIRAAHNCKVQHECNYLIPTIEQAPVLSHLTLELHRNPTRPARTAHLQIRAMSVTLEVPRNHRSG